MSVPNPGRTINMCLGTIKIAGCTLDALAYLVSWCYVSGDIDTVQPYDKLNLRQEGRTQNICAAYRNEDKSSQYFIMAVFDEDKQKYSFHS